MAARLTSTWPLLGDHRQIRGRRGDGNLPARVGRPTTARSRPGPSPARAAPTTSRRTASTPTRRTTTGSAAARSDRRTSGPVESGVVIEPRTLGSVAARACAATPRTAGCSSRQSRRSDSFQRAGDRFIEGHGLRLGAGGLAALRAQGLGCSPLGRRRKTSARTRAQHLSHLLHALHPVPPPLVRSRCARPGTIVRMMT